MISDICYMHSMLKKVRWLIGFFDSNPMKISKLTVLMASWKARRIGDCTCKLVDYETWKNCLDLIAVNGLQSLISGH